MNLILGEVLAALLPTLLQIIGIVLAAVLLRVANVARERFGVEIEARHREALHSALMTGISAALSRGFGTQAAIDAAISYATESVPDAIAALGPSGGTLRELAEAKLRQAITVPTIRADLEAVAGIARKVTP